LDPNYNICKIGKNICWYCFLISPHKRVKVKEASVFLPSATFEPVSSEVQLAVMTCRA
jgi:hypothetical protein